VIVQNTGYVIANKHNIDKVTRGTSFMLSIFISVPDKLKQSNIVEKIRWFFMAIFLYYYYYYYYY